MQQLWESVKLALDSIWSNKLRSLLTLLGNIVAVSSIIAVVALIQGVNGAVSDAIVGDLGADYIQVRRMGIARNQDDIDRMRNNPRITLAEAEAIERFGGAITAVMAQAQQNATIAYRTQELEAIQVQGVTENYLDFSTFDAERGRMMSPIEVSRSRPVALVGWQVADRLFGPEDPLDKIIKVAGVPFRVVGVSAKKGAFFGNSQDEFVVIPLGNYQKLFGSRQSLNLTVKPRDPLLFSVARDEVRTALRVARHLEPGEDDNFGMASSDSFLDIFHQATNGIAVVLVGVVGLSLLVGGIVIMNIMLMVVSERTREIGLRKALGAKRRDILSQVLTESVTLSICGGVVGVVLGTLFAKGLAAVTPLPAVIELWSVGLGVAVTALVGLFFGWYPAQRAAGLAPIEALRRE
jgi:putative ABC transport system permease protein